MDHWIEIMTWLHIDAPSLILTCKSMYDLYQRHSYLWPDGYIYSPFQLQVQQMIVKTPFHIQYQPNRGLRTVLINTLLKLGGSIMLPLKLYQSWQRKNKNPEVSFNKKGKLNISYNRLMSEHDIYCNTDQLNYIWPTLKIIYPLGSPIVEDDHLICYRDETVGTLYLPGSARESLTIRLNQLLQSIVDDHRNAYPILVLTDGTDDIDMMNHVTVNKYSKPIDKKFKTVVFLWPGHYHLDVIFNWLKMINHMCTSRIKIYFIHSSIEEVYLLKCKPSLRLTSTMILNKNPRKLEFLVQVRRLMPKMHLIPDQLIYDLLYTDKALPMINRLIYKN